VFWLFKGIQVWQHVLFMRQVLFKRHFGDFVVYATSVVYTTDVDFETCGKLAGS
jgi:hypothetical protein